jgi:hypothetical protein
MLMRIRFLSAVFLGAGLSAVGCGDDDPTSDTGTGTGMGTGNGRVDAGPVDTGGSGMVDMGMQMQRCEPAAMVECVDAQITDLNLFDTPSPDGVTNEPLDEGFRSVIDATGGVMFGGGPPVPTQSYVYLRFTESGLEKVELSDEEAFESADWDIAARRFIVRLNSGVSGPSCVQIARTAPDTEFGALTEVPDGLDYRTEEYYSTGDCTIVSDGSGIGAPGTALGSYWTYRGCVEMTGNVYVVELADGRSVKLEVESYYSPDVQEFCDANGRLPEDTPSGSGRVQLRWAFLD